MEEIYKRYFTEFDQKNRSKIEKMIERVYPPFSEEPLSKYNLTEYQKRGRMMNQMLERFRKIEENGSKSKTKSKTKSNSKTNKGKDYQLFLIDYIQRLILKRELKSKIYRSIQNEKELELCLKERNEIHRLEEFRHYGYIDYTAYYRLEDKIIKIINLTENIITNDEDDIEKQDFLKEMTIATKAGEMGFGPKIYDYYVCYNETNLVCYGIVYMEYLEGSMFYNFQHRTEKNISRIRNILERKLNQLHQQNIFFEYLHDHDILIQENMKHEVIDLFILNYTLADYITEYVYRRNHRANQELLLPNRKIIYKWISRKILLTFV